MVGSKTVISPAPAPKAPRAPAAVEHGLPDGSKLNLQVNFCKNPTCPNYGVPVVGAWCWLTGLSQRLSC